MADLIDIINGGVRHWREIDTSAKMTYTMLAVSGGVLAAAVYQGIKFATKYAKGTLTEQDYVPEGLPLIE